MPLYTCSTKPTHTCGCVALWESCSLTSSPYLIPYIHSSWSWSCQWCKWIYAWSRILVRHKEPYCHPSCPHNFMGDNVKDYRALVESYIWHTQTHTHTDEYVNQWWSPKAWVKCPVLERGQWHVSMSYPDKLLSSVDLFYDVLARGWWVQSVTDWSSQVQHSMIWPVLCTSDHNAP